jgi:hypothetical protein
MRLTARQDEPTAPENYSTVRQNHSTAPKNPPTARFFAKNTPKQAKTTPFPRPATPTGQKATPATCRTILVLTRHLTPALSPNSVGGEGETLAASVANQRRDWPDGYRQIKNHPKAFPSPVGRERVRVRAIPISISDPTQLTTKN